ncbi:hypothetical protein METHB2_20049 [Candidatus Methylobacter favarea]|uniref:Uncharacterized protein n=1 Tax=Candidatus Methylobacter favarea TaxID=2707345 RepID=A0A8S0Y9I7_9GAMM|nr:hypothetical protein METHB2_20049 [Candidatus Methylobacter favarea]
MISVLAVVKLIKIKGRSEDYVSTLTGLFTPFLAKRSKTHNPLVAPFQQFIDGLPFQVFHMANQCFP